VLGVVLLACGRRMRWKGRRRKRKEGRRTMRYILMFNDYEKLRDNEELRMD
jgi:hypothetical protein